MADSTFAGSPFGEGLKELLTSGKYSDLEVSCGTHKWRVHMAVLCSQSDFFAKACDGGFKEANEGKIDLSDDDPNAVTAMIHFFYQFDYDDVDIAGGAQATMSLNASIVVLADKYDVGALKDIATSRFIAEASLWWKTDEFADVANELFTTPTDVTQLLRDFIATIATQRASELLAKASPYEAFRKTFSEVPLLAAEVAYRLSACYAVPSSVADELRTCEFAWYRCRLIKCSKSFFTVKVESEAIRCPSCQTIVQPAVL